MTRKGRRIVSALVLGGLVLAAGWGLWVIRPVLAPFLMAIGIAYLLAPLVNGLARLGLSRGWAILAVYALLGALSTLAFLKLLPAAVAEVRRLTESIPLYSERARGLTDGLQRWVWEMGLPPEIRESLDRAITQVEVRSVATLQGLLDVRTLSAAAEFILSLLLAPFLAFYLLKDLDRFKERFLLSLPRRYRQEIIQLLRGLDRVLSGFVRGQILLGMAVGTLAAAATWALGLRFAVLLGIWAGVTEFIPYVGPLLGAVPAVLAGLSISPWKAVEVAIAFAVIQQLENAVLSPKILGESVGLHPIVVLFAVLAGGYLAGGWGLILALPAAGLVRVLWCFLIARLTEAPAAAVLTAPASRPEVLPADEEP
ncbi:MAG: AI-2E family transporter [Bacillota bacterium]